MPGVVSVEEFAHETREDVTSPTTSTFVTKIPQFRQSIACLEEMLDHDRDSLNKMRKAVKAISNSGNAHHDNEMFLAKQLERLASNRDECPELSAAFQRFSAVTQELCALMRTLTQNLNNTVLFPLDNLMKGDLKGGKGDLKRPFDKAWKDYENKFLKIEKEKHRQAKEAGLIRSGELSAAELADVMEAERKMFQLQMCEYLIKVNEIKTKKGVDLLQHLVDFHHAQDNYFRDGLKRVEQFGLYVQELQTQLQAVRSEQEADRRQLLEVRTLLQQSHHHLDAKEPVSTSPGYSLHRPQGDKAHGFTRRGWLKKKSDGVRKVWQKRRSEVRDGYLYICHSDETKPPTTFNLLTCHVKPVADDPRAFDLISFNRTYHLQAEDEADRVAWMSVLMNCKEGALQKVFDDTGRPTDEVSQGLRELQQSIISAVLRLPGNDCCCDCGSQNDVTWLSTNFGILVCIECSGIHRDLGVHISRIQSLTLDHVGTSQLLLARVMSNNGFNDVMEARLDPAKKLKQTATMEDRYSFIRAKYVERRFALHSTNDPYELLQDVELAVSTRHLYQLLAAFAEGADLTAPITGSQLRETALHLAVRQEVDGSSLHMVDFLVQNSDSVNTQTAEGNTALHYCAIYNRPECMKLLLRAGADPRQVNNNGKTPRDIAGERGYALCKELLEHALAGKKSVFENVSVDSWNLSNYDDGSTDFSDDETTVVEDRDRHQIRSSTDSLRSSPSTSRRTDAARRPAHSKRPRPVGGVRPIGGLQRPRAPPPPAPAGAPAAGGPLRLANGRSTESLCSVVSETGEVGRPRRQRAESYRPVRRCCAMYDCDADNDDELTFSEGEIIVILAESTSDEDWMEGCIESEPHRRGMFPMSFVYMLND
ncbi:arfGAP with SH3 domain, ANK repeat and PH domain-containing protein-like [Amphibalanus amphitrite]|uniref:arfGAP with SH3 domain, ANK repeat and PH domain-containing protein-like n=1 Tax=Amphibalanus amphitrite TaxID=1232801 RepID=UPI001C90116F|nr:arfGAP with SH3 domain, ANK repeat and PH domain-containing protein-like [Amphibalanus amphitrite]XP_043203828.1 arfGAP with SH3 domain, ANK repeat and PH domain-containing protein-like [Amphibalanus amphitrite]